MPWGMWSCRSGQAALRESCLLAARPLVCRAVPLPPSPFIIPSQNRGLGSQGSSGQKGPQKVSTGGLVLGVPGADSSQAQPSTSLAAPSHEGSAPAPTIVVVLH